MARPGSFLKANFKNDTSFAFDICPRVCRRTYEFALEGLRRPPMILSAREMQEVKA